MSISPADLGWWITGLWAAGTVVGWIQDWITNRYEIGAREGRGRITRRWYGPAAHVILRAAAGDDDPDRFAVLDWWDDNTAIPWLWVHKLDPEYMTYWAEDAEPFWAPVTDFAPYAVRRIRPYLYRFGRIRLPWLTQYVLLMSGADLGERLPAFGFPGDELELTPPGTGPLVPDEPRAKLSLEHSRESVPLGVGDDLDGVRRVPLAEDFQVERARSIGHASQDNSQRSR